jgi:hypothetical protein
VATYGPSGSVFDGTLGYRPDMPTPLYSALWEIVDGTF